MVWVPTDARTHFSFPNLNFARSRLYGGVGITFDKPRAVVVAEPAPEVRCRHSAACEYTEQAVELLGVEGVDVSVECTLSRHADFGSRTQLVLAVLRSVAAATDRKADVCRLASEMGRGERSGVSIATFEAGGAIPDAGCPTARFATDRPKDDSWSVPTIAARHRVLDHWRFLLVVPNADPGHSGTAEESSMRSVVGRTDAQTGDRIAGIVTRRPLLTLVGGSAERFSEAAESVDRLNGTWYVDEQGGAYRSPVGASISSLSEPPVVYGVGQSSWGSTVYGATDAGHVDKTIETGRVALSDADIEGTVSIARGRNRSANIE